MNLSPMTMATTKETIAEASNKTVVSSDFQTFLKMLTTQMQNQDPLNPVESQDFAVQLATFSGVEQQVRTNDLLAALGGQMGVSGLSQMAGWIGMDARVDAPAVFSGMPVTVFADVPTGSDAATLVVTDANGTVVSREPISVAGGSVHWSGADAHGTPLPWGVYRFAVEGTKDDNVVATIPAEVYSRITEARSQDGEILLTLESGAEIAASAVTGLREAAIN